MTSEETAIEMDRLNNEQGTILDHSAPGSSDESDNDTTEKTAEDVQDHFAVRDVVPQCRTFAGMKIVDFFDRDKIKIGQRVVRGVDWDREDEDGGEGNVGTVVEILNNSQQVRVQWDSQDTLNAQENPYKFIYRTGMDKKYDLRLFDNAQTGVYHKFCDCDSCGEVPIRGMRWRCLYCEDYNLCTECYMCDIHEKGHVFERHQRMKTISVNVGMRADLQDVKAKGIFPSSDVKSRKDPHLTGTVETVDDNIAITYNCDAKVTWEEEGFTKRYRVGREGKVDIMFTEPARVKYFQDHLQGITKGNVAEGIRVVKKSDNDDVTVGTITHSPEIDIMKRDAKRGQRRPITNDRGSLNPHQRKKVRAKEKAVGNQHCLVTVQLDNGQIVKMDTKEILLFDNSQIGIYHDALCAGCESGHRIKGMRWRCTECPNYDLCTSCYMSAKDKHIDHKFQRITEPAEREQLKTTRTTPGVQVRTALGMFTGAKVQELEGNTDKAQGKKGTITEICHYRKNEARCIVVVNRDGDVDEQVIGHFTDFQNDQNNECFFYYPSHLPDLGKDIQGYVEVKDKTSHAKIDVELWYERDVPKCSPEVQHSLYLIFAHKPEEVTTASFKNTLNRFRPLEDVRKFARKSRLPCQLAVEKVLFVDEAVVIHKDTTTCTIQNLIDMGVRKLVRGDTREDEDEQLYFLRMSVYLSGKIPLPAFVSLRNGVTHTDALFRASGNKIPVICFKKETKKVYVLTMEDDVYCVKAMEHKIDLKAPWKVTNVIMKDYDVGSDGGEEDDDEITQLEDIPADFENVAALISSLLIGVYMYACSFDASRDIFGGNSHIYPNALSMHLMKTGQWKIPKNFIKGSFNHRSIEFICEQKMTEQFQNGLWRDLVAKTKSAYVVPKWKRKGIDYDERDVAEWDLDSEGRLDVKISGLYGLIFFALLRKGYYDGAKQLIETGCVRISHLLIGCVILQEAADDWNTSQLQKEKVLQMKALCTQQALRITSCLHEADADDRRKNREGKVSGLRIDHAGKLLLNHGYLSSALKTENSAYLNDEIVKKVISQMWYKHDSFSFKKGMLFVILILFHFLLLPPFMFTMETTPFKWFYKQYQIPAMKVLLNGFGWLMILNALAYMLLFDFTGGISRTDWFIIAWMTSFFLDETKQVIISIRRGKIGSYLRDWWNRLDWLTLIVYCCGMLTKLGGTNHNACKTLLVLAFILMCARFLNLLMISEIIGAKLVMIKRMFVDTFAFLAITTVITVCYSVSYYAILYSEDSELSFAEMERVFGNGFWILFGELALEQGLLKEPECTFNRTLYSSGKVERCPSELGLALGPYLKAVYALFAIILLLNLLIAMYSHTFEEVHERSKFYWALLQTDFLEEYSVKSIFPIHFQLLILPVCLVHFLLCFLRSGFQKCDCKWRYERDAYRDLDVDEYDKDVDDRLNHCPMFVRVFLYDTNYDLNLKATREAEGQAALKASGDLEVTDEDKLTVIQKKIKNQKRITVNIDGRTSKILQEIKQMKRDIKNLYKAVSPDTVPEDNIDTD
ncbi:uncharacterized protein LOC125661033 isoform X1 [Ostrea edulis]|uniref:uncharacterized protein LOC125661033 isoform X1 n=1 Tax=Ostrea edulis TaxID=37623 RepID=UPI0024AF649C|nr:uncharacterized protein LOC125661033 isoform X1 [Ostrea edulis]